MLTPKQTALRNTLLIMASGLATGLTVSLAFAYLTIVQMSLGVCLILLAFGIKMVYDIELDKAERIETLRADQ